MNSFSTVILRRMHGAMRYEYARLFSFLSAGFWPVSRLSGDSGVPSGMPAIRAESGSPHWTHLELLLLKSSAARTPATPAADAIAYTLTTCATGAMPTTIISSSLPLRQDRSIFSPAGRISNGKRRSQLLLGPEVAMALASDSVFEDGPTELGFVRLLVASRLRARPFSTAFCRARLCI